MLDGEGFKRKRFVDLLEEMESKSREAFGEKVNTSERSVLGIILRIFAWFLAKSWEKLEDVYNAAYLSKSTGNSLYKSAANHGTIVFEEEKAVGRIIILGLPGTSIPVGFRCGTKQGILFESTVLAVIEANGSCTVDIRALSAGLKGNVPASAITEIMNPTVSITSVSNNEPTAGGRDRESELDFRNRALLKVRTPGASGNKYDYMKWALEIPGVGMAKVFPLWNGPKTIKVVIVSSSLGVVDAALVSKAQDHIDPVLGRGEGRAPVGAEVTVKSAVAKVIKIQTTIVLTQGYSLQAVLDEFKKGFEAYRRIAVFNEGYVSHAKVGSVLLDTPGIVDYSDLTLNGSARNVVLADEEIPILGDVILEV